VSLFIWVSFSYKNRERREGKEKCSRETMSKRK
jgi:hypothetical protein